MGSALTLYRSEHLGVSTFRNQLSAGWAAAADGFAAWVVLIVSAGLTWASVPLLQSVFGQTTVSGLLPASIDYWPLLIGGGGDDGVRPLPPDGASRGVRCLPPA